jgi:transcriptional regulator with XRE-family HTH domain
MSSKILETITAIRKERGMTQEQLALASGLSTTYINQLERGRKSPTLKSLENICKALNVPFPIVSILSVDKSSMSPEKWEGYQYLIDPVIRKIVSRYFPQVPKGIVNGA